MKKPKIRKKPPATSARVRRKPRTKVHRVVLALQQAAAHAAQDAMRGHSPWNDDRLDATVGNNWMPGAGRPATADEIKKVAGDGCVDHHSDHLHGDGRRTEPSDITDHFDEAPFDPEMTAAEVIAAGIERRRPRRDPAEIVAQMQRLRRAPCRDAVVEKPVEEEPPPAYSVATQDAAKAREQYAQQQEMARQLVLSENIKARVCLLECAKTVADAIVRAARIGAGDPDPEDLTDSMFDEVESPWKAVGAGLPLNCWLETTRDGEGGRNLCKALIRTLGDPIEWIEFGPNGRTTVTHSTFAAPTHWRWPEPKQEAQS